jgi:hypothetical protein
LEQISTPSVVAQTSRRLKGKYDISAYQTERRILAVRNNDISKVLLPSYQIRSLSTGQGDQAGFLPLVACDFPESINEGFASPSTSEKSRVPRIL